MMNVITKASREFGFVTKYRVIIEAINKTAAMAVLSIDTSNASRRSSKCLALSHSYGDKFFLMISHVCMASRVPRTTDGNGQ